MKFMDCKSIFFPLAPLSLKKTTQELISILSNLIELEDLHHSILVELNIYTRTFTSVSLHILSLSHRRKLTDFSSLNQVLKWYYITEVSLFQSSSFSSTQLLIVFMSCYADLTDTTNLVYIISSVQPTEIYNLAAQSHVKVSFDMAEYTVCSFPFLLFYLFSSSHNLIESRLLIPFSLMVKIFLHSFFIFLGRCRWIRNFKIIRCNQNLWSNSSCQILSSTSFLLLFLVPTFCEALMISYDGNDRHQLQNCMEKQQKLLNLKPHHFILDLLMEQLNYMLFGSLRIIVRISSSSFSTFSCSFLFPLSD